MGKQTVTLILDFLRDHPGMHATSEVARKCGIDVSTASKNLGLLWKHEPGVERMRAGLYMYRAAETPARGPESNGAHPPAPADPFAPAGRSRSRRDDYGAAVQAELTGPDDDDGGDPFAPRYGPPFRIRIESSFVARSGRTCYRVRSERGREGTLFWEDDPWQ